MRIRPATPLDYDDVARLMPELRVDDPIPSFERFVSELVQRTLVVDADGTIVGYALFDLFEEVGYVRNIVSDPRYRRHGVGAAMMAALRARFINKGATTWCLNVKPTNRPAIALYEQVGLRAAYHSAALRLASDLPLPPPSPETSLIPIPPGVDAHLEPEFGLLRGQLASARARTSRSVLQLVHALHGVEGVAVFADAIPGAFPFRTNAANAADFLAHLRPHVPPDAPFLQVGVEDNDALRAAVLELGARVHLEILHMRGGLRARNPTP